MPHYRDGTAAQPGDLVMGMPVGVTRPIIGEVVCVGGETPCTIHVAHPEVRAVGPNEDLPLQGLYFGPLNEAYGAKANVSTGLAGDFELLWREGDELVEVEAAVLESDQTSPATSGPTNKLTARATRPMRGGKAGKAK